jgi:VanZ family protein
VHRSSAIPLALLYGALIVYASLYPFTDWSRPGHLGLLEILHLPLPPWRIPFDMASNLLGYMPLGFLIYVAGVRSRYHPVPVALLACVAPSALSYAMEVTQQFLPGRYPSALDWILNSAGAVAGTAVAAILQGLTLIDRWAAARDRWFWRRSRGALVLMLLWPVGLLFPAPLPLAMGPSWERMQDGLVDWLLDVPWAQTALEWVSDIPVPEDRLPVPVEVLGTVLGLLAPCLLAYAVTRPGWRRVVLAVGALCVGLFATTLSSALNFGPAHAWAWMSPGVPTALVMGSVLALLLLPIPQRLAAALGMAVLCLQTVLVLQSPSDPYYAFSLQSWEQGQFIRFHGLAQWVGWLWPLAALMWLVVRLASSERMPPLRRRGAAAQSPDSAKSGPADA